LHFSGSFEYAIDERGRIPIPPRYRDAFRPGIVLSQGSPDRPCVRLYTVDSFEQLARKYTKTSELHQKGQDLRLIFFSRTHEVQLDQQHRILIPQILRDFAGLTTKVRLVGAGEAMQLWAPEAYEAQIARIEPGMAALLDSVEDRPE
jgi:MraZ protein